MIKLVLKLAAACFIVLVVVSGCLVALSGPSERTADPPVTVTTPSPTAPDIEDAAPAPAGIGTEVRDGDFAFVVTGVQTGIETIGTDYLDVTAQGSYTIVSVTVRNIGTEAQTFTDSSQTVLDAAGRKFSADGTAAVYLPGDSRSFLEQINPGNQVAGKVVFDLPDGTTAAVIELHDSPFSGGVRVALT